jgi:integrase
LWQSKGQSILKEPQSKRSRRTITLPRFALDALQEHRHAMLREGNIAAPVFCTESGRFTSRSNLLAKMFKRIIRKANKALTAAAKEQGATPSLLPDLRFHDLRHSHATTLLARGHSIKAVSQRLGHESIEITLKTYAHVLPTDDAALAEGLEKMLG